MPRGDRTGPTGMGPMTGRGMGFCAGSDSPGYTRGTGGGFAGPGFGPGGFFGRGGRGWRHWYHMTGLPGWARAGIPPNRGPVETDLAPEEEVEDLKAQAGYLEESLRKINKRLRTLEEKAEGDE